MIQKKLFFLFGLLLSMIGTKAFAYDIAVKNADGVTIYYNYINDVKELEVTRGQTTYSGSVVIPEDVTYMNRTRRVTSIGEKAFIDCHNVTSVTLPNSVTIIRDAAFNGCDNLTTINLPVNLKTIETYVFSGCSRLSSIVIPNSVTSIGESAFKACSVLTSVIISNRLTKIEQETFDRCSGLSTIIIPNSVTSIGHAAFRECSGITSVIIPSNVTYIGTDVFEKCIKLASITIPGSVNYIGEGAFRDCDIPEIISKIVVPFRLKSYTFSNNTFLNATLYVPKGTIDKYKVTEGWSKFVYIEEGEGSGKTPGNQKCEKPTISYQSGKLTFHSATDGAICHSTITDADIDSYNINEIQLGVTYNITVYATKSGYDDSETATATLCWVDVEPKAEGITNGVTTVRAKAVMIQNTDGQLIVNGLDEGDQICVYSTNGTMMGSAISHNGSATISTNLRTGSVAIVKIGDRNIKIILK